MEKKLADAQDYDFETIHGHSTKFRGEVNEWIFIWEIGVAGEITVALKKDELRVSRGRKESTVSEVAAGY